MNSHAKTSLSTLTLAITLTAASLQQQLVEVMASRGRPFERVRVCTFWQLAILVAIAASMHAFAGIFSNVRRWLSTKRQQQIRRRLSSAVRVGAAVVIVLAISRCHGAAILQYISTAVMQFGAVIMQHLRCDEQLGGSTPRLQLIPSWPRVAEHWTGTVAYAGGLLLSILVEALLAAALWQRLNEQKIRTNWIHRLETAQRKLAWINFYKSKNLDDLPVFRRNNEQLLSDYAHFSTAELQDEAEAAESRELNLPFEQRFEFLLESVKQQDQGAEYQASLGWQARLWLEAARKRRRAMLALLYALALNIWSGVVTMLAVIWYLLDCAWRTLRWQLAGFVVMSALLEVSQRTDAALLLELVTIFGAAFLRTAMLAWLTCELLFKHWQSVLSLSVPGAYWLHDLAYVCFGEALAPLTLPLLLANVRAGGTAVIVGATVTCAPWLLLSVPQLLQCRWWLTALTMALQCRSGLATLIPKLAFAPIQPLQSVHRSLRDNHKLRFACYVVLSVIAAALIVHLFHAFTGFDFDASLGYPGEGPVHDCDEKDDYEMEFEVSRQAEDECRQSSWQPQSIATPQAKSATDEDDGGVRMEDASAEDSEFMHVGRERLTRREWRVANVGIRRPDSARKSRGNYLYLTTWHNCATPTWEPWAAFSDAVKQWYRDRPGPKKDPDKYKRIYELEERKLKQQHIGVSERSVRRRKSAPRRQCGKKPAAFRHKRGQKSPTSTKRQRTRKTVDKPELLPPVETVAETEALTALLASLDSDFDRRSADAAANFLNVASWGTVKQAVERYRALTSEPHCARAVCCVCDEMKFRRELHVYAVNESPAAQRQQIDLLPDAIRAGMIAQLTGNKQQQVGAWREQAVWKPFKHCMLSSAGMDATNGWLNVCDDCADPLRNGELPKFAIANSLFFGATPPELAALTWTEQQLLALNRVHINILHLEAEDIVNKRAPRPFKPLDVLKKNNTNKVLKLGKCNAICLPHHAATVLKVLPESADQLSKFLRVVFTKSDATLPQPMKLKWILAARRSVLKAALEYLHANNPLYQRVELSQSNLETFPDPQAEQQQMVDDNSPEEAGIPQPFWDDIIVPTRAQLAKADGAGYAAGVHDEDDDDGDEDNDNDRENEVVDLDNREQVLGRIHHRGFVDVGAKLETVKEIGERVAESLQDENEVASREYLNVPEGGPDPVGYRNPSLVLGAFPELYPLGIGGPQCRRREKLTLVEYVRHLLLLSDDRFRTHAIWPFFMFNSLQIQRASKGAFRSMAMKRFLTSTENRQLLTPANISAALKDLKKADRRGQQPRLHHIKDHKQREALRHLMSDINTIGRQLPLTAGSKYQARCEIQALMARFGVMDLFVTVNPNDTHAPLMCKFAGENIRIGENDPDVPEGKFSDNGDGLPSGKRRRQLLARDPLAAVLYSHFVMQAFLKALAGFDSSTGQRDGIFGRVAAFHFNPEEQGRGSLHYHGMIILDSHLSRRQLLEELKKPEFQKRVLEYLDNLIAQQPPAFCNAGPFAKHQYRSSRIERKEHLCKSKLAGGPEECGQTHLDGSKCMAAKIGYNRRSNHVCFSRVPAPGSDEQAFWRRIGDELDRIVPAVQTHGEEHNASCVHWKDKKKRAKNRWGNPVADYVAAEWKKLGFKCRYKYAKGIVNKSSITKDGCIRLERQHHWTNSYNALMLACLRSNHDIQSTWGTDLQAQGAAIYMTNYATKQQRHLQNLLPLLETAVKKIAAQPKSVASTNQAVDKRKQRFSAEELNNKQFLNKVFNQLQKNVELSAHTVIGNLLGLPERYTSHQFQPLLLTEFLNWAEVSDVERGYQSADPEARRLNAGETFQLKKMGGKVAATNLRLNYTCRPIGLEACSLYDFVAGARVVKRAKKPKAGQAPCYPLAVAHPQAAKFGLEFHPDRYVPKVFVKPLPVRSKHPERFAKLILLRFKPFRNIADLRPTGSTWQEALADFEAKCSNRVRRLIANLESLRDAEDAHVADHQRQLNELHLEMKAERRKPRSEDDAEGGEENDFYDLSALAERDQLDESDDFEQEEEQMGDLEFFHPRDDGTLKAVVDTMISKDAYPSQRASRTTLHQYVDFDYGSSDTRADVESARDELKQLLSASAKGELAALMEPHFGERHSEPEKPRFELFVGSSAIEHIEKKRSLNKKQRLAFRIIVQRLEAELVNENKAPKSRVPVPQLKMYISGVGGTGKSHVIKAVQDWCTIQGREEWLQCAAFTGSAATQIGGRTLNSLLGIPRNCTEVRESNVKRRGQVEQALANVKLLVVDEVSLIQCPMAAAINFSLQQAKGVLKQASPPDWGGMHIVFLGDHYQLPPVRGKGRELYDAANAQKTSSDFAWLRAGRLLWENVDTHIQLTEQMRQSDEGYLRMLMNLREGRCDEQDYKLLQSCLLKDKLGKAWQHVPIGVASNPVRSQLSLDHILAQGRAAGKTVLIARAEDARKRGGEYDGPFTISDEKHLRRRADHSTGGLPGIVPLLTGAQYLLRKNEHNGAEFGFVNGARCILRSVKLHENEPPIPNDGRAVHFLQHMPQAVWMEFPDSTMPKPLQGQGNKKLIPIVPLTEKGLKAKIGGWEFEFARHQLPISPARAITAYACQGRTYKEGFIVDLNMDFDRHDSRSVYVLLSRVKCRHMLRIVSPFEIIQLQTPPPEPLLAESTRLKGLERLTFRRYAEMWSEIEAAPEYYHKAPSECPHCANQADSAKTPPTDPVQRSSAGHAQQEQMRDTASASSSSQEHKHGTQAQSETAQNSKRPQRQSASKTSTADRPKRAPPQLHAIVERVDTLPSLQQQRSDCGLYAHYFANVLQNHEAELTGHLYQNSKQLCLPELTSRAVFNSLQRPYRAALGGRPLTSSAENLYDEQVRALGLIGPEAQEPILFSTLTGSRMVLLQGRPDDDTTRLKRVIFDENKTGVAIVNTTQPAHWIAVGLLRLGGRRFRAVVADSMNPDDKSTHVRVVNDLANLVLRHDKLDRENRLTTLQHLDEIESAAKRALPQYAEGISAWTELLQAVFKGHHKLWGHDVGKETVQRMMRCWRPLIEQGSRITEDTTATFLAKLKVADRETVARKCLWAQVGRRIGTLQSAPIMQQQTLTNVRQAIQQLLHENLNELGERAAKAHFAKVVECARSTRDQLWQQWMSQSDSE